MTEEKELQHTLPRTLMTMYTMDSKQVGNSTCGKWLKAEQGENKGRGQRV